MKQELESENPPKFIDTWKFTQQRPGTSNRHMDDDNELGKNYQ